MSDNAFPPIAFKWGYLAIGAGALALAMAMLVIFGGPFAPQQSVGTTIGEIAGEIRASALRALKGEPQPAPVARGWDIDRVLLVAAPLIGAGAILLSIVSAIRRENWRLSVYGATLGIGAIVVQFVWWLALLFCGVLLLVAIVENIGDILGG